MGDVMGVEINREGIGITLNLPGWLMKFGVFRKPYKSSVGICSIVDDGKFPLKHVLFVDYDNIQRDFAEKELMRVYENMGLTPFYFFTTWEKEGRGNYHAISLTKMTFHEVYDVLSKMHVDPDFALVPLKLPYRSWILRVIGKGNKGAPRFLKMIPEKDWNLEKEVSRAHLNFLEKHYGVPHIDYKNVDDSELVFISTYLTAR
jgi:hypothetical protein